MFSPSDAIGVTVRLCVRCVTIAAIFATHVANTSSDALAQ